MRRNLMTQWVMKVCRALEGVVSNGGPTRHPLVVWMFVGDVEKTYEDGFPSSMS